MDLKTLIEKTLSEILSDKYNAKITIKFENREENKDVQCVQENSV